MARMAILALALSGALFAASLGLENALINGGFETGALTPWQGEATITQLWDAGAYPWQISPQEGDYFAMWESRGDPIQGTLTQTIELTPGLYDIDLSGYAYAGVSRFAGSRLEIQLIVDGQLLEERVFNAYSGNFGWWGYFELTSSAQSIQNHIAVTINYDLWADPGYSGDEEIGVACVDGLDLEFVLIPEPATTLMLMAGLPFLALARRSFMR